MITKEDIADIIKKGLIASLYFVLVGYFIVSCLMLSKGISDKSSGGDLCGKEYRYSIFVPSYSWGCYFGEELGTE